MATQKRTTSTRKKTSGKKTSGRKSSANGRGKSSSAPTFTWRAELLLFAFLAFAIPLFIGNIGKGGIVGNALSKFSFGMFGVLAYIFPIPVFDPGIYGIKPTADTNWIYIFRESNHESDGRNPAVCFFVRFCTYCLLVGSGAGKGDTIVHRVCFLKDRRRTGRRTDRDWIFKMFWHDGGGTAGYLDYGDRSSAFDRKKLFKGVSKGSKHVYESARSDAARRRAAAQERNRERQSQREQMTGNDRKKERRMNRKVSGVALDTKIRPRKEEKVTENMSELSLNPQDPIREDVLAGSEPTAGAAKKRKTAATVQMPVTEPEDITQAVG